MGAPNEAFVSLRNAYRLLDDYHRRVFETVRLVREGIEREMTVNLKPVSWRPYGLPDLASDVLKVRDPPEGLVSSFCATLYVKLASKPQASPGTFLVYLAHESKAYDPGEAPPQIAVFMAAIPRAAAQNDGLGSWANMAGRLDADEKFQRAEDWSDGKVHHAQLEGTTIGFGGFAVCAPELGTPEEVDTKLSKPLALLIAEVLG